MIYACEFPGKFKKADFSTETDFRFKVRLFHGYCTVIPFDIANNDFLNRLDKESRRRYGKSYEEMIPEIKKMFYSVNLLNDLLVGRISNEEELKKRVAEEREMDERCGIFW